MSVATGIAAAAIVFFYASAVRAEAAEAQEEALARYGDDVVSVCVATCDIDPGETIDEGNTQVEQWLASLLPEDALTSLEDAYGQTATSHIPENAVLSSAYFERDDEAVEIPSGTVAVSVACDAEHAVGGALEEGELVSVYVSKDGVSDLLTSAQVLDTNVLSDGGGDLEWVTLAVEADAVEELLAATTRGTITLVVPGAGASLESDAEEDAEDVGASADEEGSAEAAEGEDDEEGGE